MNRKKQKQVTVSQEELRLPNITTKQELRINEFIALHMREYLNFKSKKEIDDKKEDLVFIELHKEEFKKFTLEKDIEDRKYRIINEAISEMNDQKSKDISDMYDEALYFTTVPLIPFSEEYSEGFKDGFSLGAQEGYNKCTKDAIKNLSISASKIDYSL